MKTSENENSCGLNDDERVVGRVWAAGLLVVEGSWAEGHFDSAVCVFAWRRL